MKSILKNIWFTLFGILYFFILLNLIVLGFSLIAWIIVYLSNFNFANIMLDVLKYALRIVILAFVLAGAWVAGEELTHKIKAKWINLKDKVEYYKYKFKK